MINEIRMGMAVKRFHTTHRTQAETVGHHSANVCAILLRLEPLVSKELLVRALMHDVPEYYTGDVPAPFKWDNAEAKSALNTGELRYIRANDIPSPEIDIYELALLKLADMLDLVLSSLEEVNRGNAYAIKLVENGKRYLENLPAYEKYSVKVKKMMEEVVVYERQ